MDSHPGTKTGHKRKREERASGSSSPYRDVKTYVVANTDPSSGPFAVLANFPSIEPTRKIPFSLYSSQPEAGAEGAILSPGFFGGTTDTVEFRSVNNDSEPDPGHSSRYMVGVYNKRTSTLHFVDAPMHVVPCEVIALQGLADSRSPIDAANWRASRKTLGALFGNAKALKAIKEQERRQIDVNVIQGVADHLQESIIDATNTLPAQGVTASDLSWALHESSQLGYCAYIGEGVVAIGDEVIKALPPYNQAAKTARDAYPLHGIVTHAELDALDIKVITTAPKEDKLRSLPWMTSWSRRLLQAWGAESRSTSPEDYALLIYISYLFLFLAKARPGSDRLPKEEDLHNVPSLVLDGFYSRFTERQRGDPRLMITPTSRLKLINHLLVLCLRLEDWTMNTAAVSEDLRMTPQEALGCKSSKASAEVTTTAGMPIEGKKVTLPMPLTFPKPKLWTRK
ncbi:DNA-directed RNA polymerase I subunit rpa49 [Tulasnella sp. 331]|nr:DNA-directed RNA polymerase I subunit rpa49 [Tulasnella sp. 331]